MSDVLNPNVNKPEPWFGVNSDVMALEKKIEGQKDTCKYVPHNFGDLSYKQYLTFKKYPKPLFGSLRRNHAPAEVLGDWTVDDGGVEYIYIKNSDTNYYFVPCPVSVDKGLNIDSYYNFSPFLKERKHCRIYINKNGYLVFEKDNKFYSYLSFVYPLDSISNVENPKVGTIGVTGGNSNTNTNTGTTGNSSGTSTNVTDSNNVGGLQGRGQKGQQKQLGNGQNWYMFLIPILLWFYKKKND